MNSLAKNFSTKNFIAVALILLLSNTAIEAQNIGVNTTGASPAATNLFEVLQPSSTDNTVGIYVNHSGAPTTSYGLQAIASGAGINNIAAYLSATGGSGTNYALIVPAGGGNVGIGTSNPNYLFTVFSSGIGSYFEREEATTNTPHAPIALLRTSSGGAGANGIGSRLAFFAETTTEGSNEAIGLITAITTDATTGSVDADIYIEPYSSSANVSNALVVKSTGNIGIGTTAPNAKLHVSSGSGYSLTTPIVTIDNTVNSAESSILFRGKNSGSINRFAWLTIDPDAGTFSIDRNTPNNQRDFVIDLAGNIGLGVAAPLSKLVVVENNESGTLTDFTQGLSKAGMQISTEYTVGSYTPGIFWQTSNENATKPKAGIWMYQDGSGSDLYFGTSNTYGTGITNTGLVLDQSGNVGIGATTPNTVLQIHNTGTGFVQQLTDASTGTTSGDGAFFSLSGLAGVDADNLQFIHEENKDIEFLIDAGDDGITQTDEVMRITRTGNVGIGTATPGNKLQVNGNITLGTTALDMWSQGINFLTCVLQRQSSNISLSYNFYRRNSDSKMITLGGTDAYAVTMGDFIPGGSGGGLGFYADAAVPAAGGDLGTPTIRMVIAKTGNVGIGCVSPVYTLDVRGTLGVSGQITTGSAVITTGVAACSDVRYKKEIKPLQSSLQNVLKLEGVNYYWKKDQFPEKSFNDDLQIGFIAQEIEKLYPQLVMTDINGYKAVDYSRLTPILVEAIKEQQEIIESLKNKNDSQDNEINNLKAEIEKINSYFEAKTEK